MSDPGDAKDPAALGVLWCLALLEGLVAGGMRRLVLSPGSRSTPVVLAAQHQPELELTPILDERSAAFYALGLARASRRPVGLLATSGSAPTHWYPAVIEAESSQIPLVLISADRPPELRGWGANQTIDQTRLFGNHVREFHDPGTPVDRPESFRALRRLGLRAATLGRGGVPGPVHINLPLREPLVPSQGWLDAGGPGARDADRPEALGGAMSLAPLAPPPALVRQLHRRLKGRGLIYCGPGTPGEGFPAALWSCAGTLGVPVLADPLSGLRFGPAAASGQRISRYKAVARNPAAARALRPDWLLRFGRAPVSRTVLEWLSGVPTLLVDPAGLWSDPGHDLALHLRADPTALCQALIRDPPLAQGPAWLQLWRQAERRLDALTADFLDDAPWCEGQLIVDLVAALPAGDGLLCANSLPIRQFETWSGSRDAPLALFANRGASGIDGQLSTLAGLNAGGVATTGLIGDLSFLHDLSGLLLARRLDRPLIVLNNGGGRIFDYLPQAALPGLDRFWRTPQHLDLGALAVPFGLDHRRVDDAAGWRQALSLGLEACRAGGSGGLIEVMIDAPRSQQVHLAFRGLVAAQDLIG